MFYFMLDQAEQIVLRIHSIDKLNLQDNFMLFDARINIILPAKIILFDSNPHNLHFRFNIIQTVSIRNLNYSRSFLYMDSAISINSRTFGIFEYFIFDVDFKYLKGKIFTLIFPSEAVGDALAEYNPVIYFFLDDNGRIFNDNNQSKERVDVQFCKYKYHQINYSDNYIGMLLTINAKLSSETYAKEKIDRPNCCLL
ncbi:hypothetical protein HZS_3597 [Henneguya salminicola]|nr:hypothetical protein HZS_3597 [Henneguya salminicola]